MNKNVLIIVLLAVILLGAGAYWVIANQAPEQETDQTPIVTSGENAPPGSIHNMPAEPAAEAAREDLAARLGVSKNSIVIMKVENKTWSDGCLGLGGAAESCLQALVEGFHVELVAQGKAYFYRTDKTGASLRSETQ